MIPAVILRKHERARRGMERLVHDCDELLREMRALKPYEKQITVLRYGAPCIDEVIPMIAALRNAGTKFIRRNGRKGRTTGTKSRGEKRETS